MKKQQRTNPVEKQYDELVKQASPNSKKALNCLKAFLAGGFICALGECLKRLFEMANLSKDEVKAIVPIALIALAAILTGLGLFEKIAKHAGAGTLVPITGFANSIVAPAMEFKTEGRVLGTGAAMFTIAGPVIAYGCGAASLYGIIFYFFIK